MKEACDIIIPVWNQSDLTISCLKSIRKFTKNYRLMLINNGSEPEEWQIVHNELQNHEKWHVIVNPQNLGFVQAVNQGLKAVTAEYVVLMNNDTEAVPHWTEKLAEPFVHYKVMLSGPLTTTPESWQGKYPKGKKGWVLRETGMLAFFCTMFRSDIFKEIGLLDESFGVGFGDDDDYCMRVLKAGYKMALVQDLVIPHHHRSTFRKIYDSDTIQSMQLKAISQFKAKHGLK
jgi:GT2 family glycosyltransferase